jgi:GAF domain-containing protein
MSFDQSPAETFGRLALDLYDLDGVEETVDAVVQFARQAVWCKQASVVLISHGRRPEIMALTDPILADLYEQQIDVGVGPLVTAIDQEQVLLIPDVAAETRWSPEWIEQVMTVGIRSSMHLPLMLAGRAQAVLSLYSEHPDGFDTDDIAVAHILARHATVAIASARHDASMAQAVDARKLVGQAMGILMERYDLDSDRAFEVLRRYSQHNNRKLRDVAQELIDTRRLPRGG